MFHKDCMTGNACDTCSGWTMSVLRIVLGIIFIGHGGQKLFGWFGGFGIEGTAGFFGQLGIVPATFWAWIVALAEFGSGIALVVGFLVPIAAGLIIVDQIVAIITVHAKNGFFVTDTGYEFNLLIIASAIAVYAFGSKAFSLSQMIKKSKKSDQGSLQKPPK